MSGRFRTISCHIPLYHCTGSKLGSYGGLIEMDEEKGGG